MPHVRRAETQIDDIHFMLDRPLYRGKQFRHFRRESVMKQLYCKILRPRGFFLNGCHDRGAVSENIDVSLGLRVITRSRFNCDAPGKGSDMGMAGVDAAFDDCDSNVSSHSINFHCSGAHQSAATVENVVVIVTRKEHSVS